MIVSNTSISPEYFKNSMSWNELSNTLNSLDENVKTSYEQTRMIMHSIYQVNSSKAIKTTDIFKFSWDKEEVETIDTEKLLSYTDAEKLINNINNNGKETV